LPAASISVSKASICPAVGTQRTSSARAHERLLSSVMSGGRGGKRTTQIYDRRRDEVSLDEVKQIVI
jgi:hypothetical protein